MDAALAEYLSGIRPDAQPTVTALHQAIRVAAPLDSALKWRKLTYGVEGDFHHWICAIDVTKQRVTLLFHFGSLLTDAGAPFRQGSSKFARMLDFGSSAEVDELLIGRLVTEAIGRLGYFKENWKRIQAEEP